jgi:hypothetical protein
MKSSSVYSHGSSVPDLNEYSAYSKGLQKKHVPVYELGFQDLDFRCTRFKEANNNKSLRAVIPTDDQLFRLTNLCKAEAEATRLESLKQDSTTLSAALQQEESVYMKEINSFMSSVNLSPQKKVVFRRDADGKVVYTRPLRTRMKMDEEERDREEEARKEAERHKRVGQMYEIKDDLGRTMLYNYNGKICPESDNPQPIVVGHKNSKRVYYWH